jgi:hypothetical protein
MNLVVMDCVMQRVQHGVRGIVILVVMGWPLYKNFIQTFFLFHIKYMRKEDELWKSNDTRGITRMSDDQRLGLTMIILPLKTTMEMKEATMLLGKVFKRLNNSLNPFETYEMIIHLQMNEEWNQIASEKMKESLERCKKKLEPFLSGSDGDGRTEKDQAKTI